MHPTPDTDNEFFNLAVELINKTNQHVFLTGKAGTGKTTFLKYIKEHSIKNTVVVAPTGVAAINAGGVTMHSFFQLPFAPYIPESNSSSYFNNGISNTADKHSLFKNIKFNNDKRKLLQELQLLIIDEISMVRADMLDATDAILRHFRKNYTVPFGGVQVLYIGDLYQLPPVVQDQEWNLLQPHYDSPFFFSAKALQQAEPLYVELQKIYRQKDQAFIDVLNKVRHNQCNIDDINKLNELYKPVSANLKTEAIVLTTHNYKADSINEKELGKLATTAHQFKGIIEGDFNEKLLPNELELTVKEQARIMFIKNDSSPEKKYFNGKLATIQSIQSNSIKVLFDNESQPYELKKESWKNLRYKLNDSNQIEEEELGSYTQFPIRLAWAVTIHKSQGLTFENIIIDAGQSFAAGQVYVALSRCTNIEGIVLHSLITNQSIRTDERIIEFSKNAVNKEQLRNVLVFEKEAYLTRQLLSFFDFRKMTEAMVAFRDLVPTKQIPDKEKIIELSNSMLSKANQLGNIAEKFEKELNQIFVNIHTNKEKLLTRTQAAIDYFSNEIITNLLHPLQQHLQSFSKASKIKQYTTAVQRTELIIWETLVKLNNAFYDDDYFNKNKEKIASYNPSQKITKVVSKEEKIPSAEVTKQLFDEGRNMEQIAVIRNLAISTIEGHLAKFVRTGEIDIEALIDKATVEKIMEAIKTDGGHATTPIKSLLSDEITHGQIRAVLNYKDWLEENNK